MVFTFCPQNAKGVEPNKLMQCLGGAPVVYWNRETDDMAGLVIAIIVSHCLGLPCVHPGMLYKFDSTNGKMGDACGCLPVHKGHDPGCCCKFNTPPCAVLMNNPDNTSGAAIACCLELTCLVTPFCTGTAIPCGCLYTLILWTPDTDGAKGGNAGAPEQEEMA